MLKYQPAIQFLILADRYGIYNFVVPRDYLLNLKVWLRLDENLRSVILKCLLP